MSRGSQTGNQLHQSDTPSAAATTHDDDYVTYVEVPDDTQRDTITTTAGGAALSGNEGQAAHIAAPAAAAKRTLAIEDVSIIQAAKDIATFWPLVLRLGISAFAAAAISRIIAQNDPDLLGAYAAYETFISITQGLLYGGIYPQVTLMSGAKRGEADILKVMELPERLQKAIEALEAAQEAKEVAEKTKAVKEMLIFAKDALHAFITSKTSVIAEALTSVQTELTLTQEVIQKLNTQNQLDEVLGALKPMHGALEAAQASLNAGDINSASVQNALGSVYTQLTTLLETRSALFENHSSILASLKQALDGLQQKKAELEGVQAELTTMLDTLQPTASALNTALTSFGGNNEQSESESELPSLEAVKQAVSSVQAALAALLESEDSLVTQALEAAREKIRITWRQGFIFSLLLTIPAMGFGLIAPTALEWFKQPEIVLENSRRFFNLALPGFVVDVLYRWTARSVTPWTKFSILTADGLDRVSEVLLGYAFLNGKWGAPEMGIAGVALAYSISKTLTLIGHLTFMRFYSALQNYHLFDCSGQLLNKKVLWRLMQAGGPAGLENVSSGIAGMLVTMFCGQSGTTKLAGLQTAAVVNGVANMHMSAVLNAASKNVGEYWEILESNEYASETKHKAAKNIQVFTKLLMAFCFVVSALACGMAFLFPRQIASLIIDDRNETQTHLNSATNFVRIQGGFQLASGLTGAARCVLDALLDNKFLFYSSVLFELITNPAAAALMHYGLRKSAEWVYAASGLGAVMMMMTFLYRCYSKISTSALENAEVVASASAKAAHEKAVTDRVKAIGAANQSAPEETAGATNWARITNGRATAGTERQPLLASATTVPAIVPA